MMNPVCCGCWEMRDDWNIAEEGSGASVEPCRLRLICPKGLLSSSACGGDKQEGWRRTAYRTTASRTWPYQVGGRRLLPTPCAGTLPGKIPRTEPQTKSVLQDGDRGMWAAGEPESSADAGAIHGPTQAGAAPAQMLCPQGTPCHTERVIPNETTQGLTTNCRAAAAPGPQCWAQAAPPGGALSLALALPQPLSKTRHSSGAQHWWVPQPQASHCSAGPP